MSEWQKRTQNVAYFDGNMPSFFKKMSRKSIDADRDESDPCQIDTKPKEGESLVIADETPQTRKKEPKDGAQAYGPEMEIGFGTTACHHLPSEQGNQSGGNK